MYRLFLGILLCAGCAQGEPKTDPPKLECGWEYVNTDGGYCVACYCCDGNNCANESNAVNLPCNTQELSQEGAPLCQ